MNSPVITNTNPSEEELEAYMGTLNSNESRALELLGDGVSAERVAGTLGVSPSLISQYLSNPLFSSLVQSIRFGKQQKFLEHDNKLDSLEAKAAAKLDAALEMTPFMKPMEAATILAKVNGLKRRTTDVHHGNPTQHTTVINLSLPVSVVSKFKVDSNNMIVESSEGKSLVTMQSGDVAKMLGNSNGLLGRESTIDIIEAEREEWHPTTNPEPITTDATIIDN